MPTKDGRLEASERMRRPPRRFRFLPGDLVIIAMILIFCVVFWLGIFLQGKYSEKKERYVRITQDGNLVLEIKLSLIREPVDYLIYGKDGNIVVHLSSDEVYIKESPCEDQICVKTGVLKKVGDGAVCLPNRVVVQIIGGEEDAGEVDAVAK